MPFSPAVRTEALVRSKRHCCVCQEFAGRSVNVHHIEPEADGGNNEIENAIVLCLRCHAEAGHYNAKHPIGNRYHPDELRQHRNEWWAWCAANPAVMPPKSPIGISPSIIDIVPSNWTRKTVATVYNRSDCPVFQIWVKLTIDGELTWDAIETWPSMTPDAVALCCHDLTIAAKCIGLAGVDAVAVHSLRLPD